MLNIKILQIILVIIPFLFNGCGDYCEKEEQLQYFPPIGSDEWKIMTPDVLGWNFEKLDETIQWVGEQNTVAFIILHQGKIIVEEYWGGGDIHKYIKIASITKSITAVLIGIAQQEGLLQIDDNVSDYIGLGWSNTLEGNEAKITIRNLLTMTSGLDEDLNYVSEPGTDYLYSTPAFYQLWLILEKASGKTIVEFTNEELFNKIGMSDAIRWYKGGALKPRDIARFGQLVINMGFWNDNDIITDMNYYNEMLSPSQEYVNCYGYLWWLNNDCNAQNGNNEFLLFPNAPDDLFAAIGAGDQRLYIIPSEELVIVRLGFDNRLPYWGEESFNNKFWDLMNEVIN
jgi:CubicO group peptidase (beta-lactamase class C family)